MGTRSRGKIAIVTGFGVSRGWHGEQVVVAGIQADLAWEDRAANHAMARTEVARAAGAGADLVVLPEMFASGFSMATETVAEPTEGPTATLLSELAATHGVWVAGSFACRHDEGLPTNRLQVVGPSGQVTSYDKIHPFTHGGEADHYAGGERPVVVEVEGVRIGLAVCYDLRFANLFWNLGPGIDAFVVPANWPCARSAHWRSLLVARAIENQAYVLGVNRVGVGRRTDGGDLDHCGDTMLVDPMGTVVAAASGAPNLVLGTIDTDEVAAVRARFRFLPDRRDVAPRT